MFLSRNKNNNIYPCKSQFYYIKVGFKGVKNIKVCFRDVSVILWVQHETEEAYFNEFFPQENFI